MLRRDGGCPRCGVKLPRIEMVRHLWARHKKLLAGRRVRSPWRLIERWTTGPGGGTANAHRNLLRWGTHDDRSLAAARSDANRRRGGLCPHCFAITPLDAATFPAADDVRPLNLSHGRLSGHGFVVELAPTLLGSRLRIETPSGVLFNGPEPSAAGLPWRSRWPVTSGVAVALLLAATLPPVWALLVTASVLVIALGIALELRKHEPDDRPDRLIDHAWRILVPRLRVEDADFVAALAVMSERHGDPRSREKSLERSLSTIRGAVGEKTALPWHLLALERLAVADATATGGDPVILLANSILPCLTGKLTPLAAELLLTPDMFVDWSRGRKARLRVLLAGRAFEAGLGVWDLHTLGRTLPSLARVLSVEDTDGLARLRMIWELRSSRPWRHCGPAATVFELANFPMLGGQHLETAPDLLLFQPLPTGGEPVHVLASGRGLIVGGQLIHDWPTEIETRPLPGSRGGGDEIRFGTHSIHVHGNVEEIVRKLTMWGDYLFGEFLPWIGNALTRSGDGSTDRLGPLTVTCPECQTSFLGRRGDLGRQTLAESS
jgi:hypothetical protein